jgi:hypothetical protein
LNPKVLTEEKVDLLLKAAPKNEEIKLWADDIDKANLNESDLFCIEIK